MNEVTRRVTEEILIRANGAIERGEAKGPKLDQCWKRIEKLNGGIVGPKSWEQIKKIAEAALAEGKSRKLRIDPATTGSSAQIRWSGYRSGLNRL